MMGVRFSGIILAPLRLRSSRHRRLRAGQAGAAALGARRAQHQCAGRRHRRPDRSSGPRRPRGLLRQCPCDPGRHDARHGAADRRLFGRPGRATDCRSTGSMRPEAWSCTARRKRPRATSASTTSTASSSRLIGNVQLTASNNQVNGSRLVIDLDSGRAVIDGGPPGVNSSGGRVTRPLHRPAAPAAAAEIARQ